MILVLKISAFLVLQMVVIVVSYFWGHKFSIDDKLRLLRSMLGSSNGMSVPGASKRESCWTARTARNENARVIIWRARTGDISSGSLPSKWTRVAPSGASVVRTIRSITG